MAEFKVIYQGNQNEKLGKEIISAHDYDTAVIKIESKLSKKYIELLVKRGANDVKTVELINTDKIVKVVIGEGDSLEQPIMPY